MKATLPDTEYWRAVIEAADLGIWDYNLETGARTYSDKWRDLRGLCHDEVLLTSDEAWLAMLHPDDVATARVFTDMINAGTAKTVAFEYRERNLQGGWTWFMCRGRAVQFDQSGLATRFVGIDTDVTAMKAMEADRAAAAQQLEIAVTIAEIGIWQFDIAKNNIRWDSRLRRIYGVPEDLDPLPRDIWEQSIHPEDRARVMSDTKAGGDSKQPYELQYRIIRKTGEMRHLRSRVAYLADGGDGPCFLGVNWDVTDDVHKADELLSATQIAQQRLAQLLAAQQELEYLSGHDHMTGLLNRRAFDSHMAKLAPDGMVTTSLGALVIDVDNLKEINDQWGHDVGDTVLKGIANVLLAEMGHVGVVARLGGDEFIAVLSKVASPQAMVQLAEAVVAKVGVAAFTGGPMPSVSIGVSSAFGQRQSLQTLIRNADRALYRAKGSGRSRVVFG